MKYLLLILILSFPVLAARATFDFSEIVTEGQSTFLFMPGINGLIGRSSGNIRVETPQPIQAPFSGSALSPFIGQTSQLPYTIDFQYSEPITSFSCDMGDSNADIDTLSIKAYSGFSGTGVLLAEATETLQPVAGQFTSKRLSVRSAGIRSVVIIGGSASAPNSVYYDNFLVTSVPTKTNLSDHFPFYGVADFTVYRPSNSVWYSTFPQDTNGDTVQIRQFGLSADIPTPNDFDGKGVADISIYRDGVWYLLSTETGTVTVAQFGLTGDIPQSSDFDGDGKADLAVFRPSNGVWYWLNSSSGSVAAVQFGLTNDIPFAGNWNGDGKADVAVFRPSTGVWYEFFTNDATTRAQQFGISTDKPVSADYDGDGINDLAIFRNSQWWIQNSSNNAVSVQNFGLANDIPVPAEYPNLSKFAPPDGRANLAVFRPSSGTWYVLNENNTVSVLGWGLQGDKPISEILP